MVPERNQSRPNSFSAHASLSSTWCEASRLWISAYAAEGAAATFEALRESRVDTLLIHDDGTQDRTAFYDEQEPGLVALERTTFDDLGRRPTGPARMHDVAIRACLLTGAGIRIVPEHTSLDEGIGAILRW